MHYFVMAKLTISSIRVKILALTVPVVEAMEVAEGVAAGMVVIIVTSWVGDVNSGLPAWRKENNKCHTSIT